MGKINCTSRIWSRILCGYFEYYAKNGAEFLADKSYSDVGETILTKSTNWVC
jgi:hypothetical protein